MGSTSASWPRNVYVLPGPTLLSFTVCPVQKYPYALLPAEIYSIPDFCFHCGMHCVQITMYEDSNNNQRLARNNFARSSIPGISTKLKELTTIDGLFSTLISDYTNETKFPDLLPTDVMDRYHDSSKTDTTTRALRRRNMETYNPFGREEVFAGFRSLVPAHWIGLLKQRRKMLDRCLCQAKHSSLGSKIATTTTTYAGSVGTLALARVF